jgi:hypothetical protein
MAIPQNIERRLRILEIYAAVMRPLYEAKGHARINVVVDAIGQARLDFLDEDGTVTSSLPNTKSSR